MRRAFTMIELMFASMIGAVIMVSLTTAMTGVWREAKKTNEELQAIVEASAMRDRALLGTVLRNAKGFHGLLNVTNEVAALSSGKVLQVDPKGPNETYESLPQSAIKNIVIGKTAKNSSKSVTVADVSPDEEDCAYNDVEKRQRVCVWLWSATKAGTVCKMPVYVTTARFEPKETTK